MHPGQVGALVSMAYGTLTTVMYFICLGRVSEMMDLGLQPNTYSTASTQQVGRDWLVQPFTDIIVTTTNYCPTSHPDLVYTRTFLGT